MKYITVDWGSYSAKIFQSRVEKKKHTHDFVDEIVFSNKKYDSQLSSWSDQLDQIGSQLTHNIDLQTKIILSIPSELLSFRFKNLPVSQSKKARAMIPFQMEDDIPFNLQETYLSATLIKEKKSFDALCFFTKKETYNDCLNLLTQKKIPISAWIHPIDPIALFAQDMPFLSDVTSTCILDIGHETTKAYFFKGKKFHSYQISHFGGQRIDEMMSSVYQLSSDQLLKFKHESAFIVPKELFSTSKLTEDQKFFAENMDQLFYSFVQEFKRWEMSFRVDTKEKVGQIYLTGGSSLIKNLDQYLSYYWERPVQPLSHVLDNFGSLKLQTKKLANLGVGDLLTYAHRQLNKTTNHLGKVSLGQSIEPIPLYSLGFVGVRAAFFSILCILLGSLYSFLLSSSESKIDAQLKTVTQNLQLDLSAIDKSQIFSSPELAVKKAEAKIKNIQNDLKRIDALNSVSALNPLKDLQTALLGTPCILKLFESNEVFQGKFEIAECNSEYAKKINSILSTQTIKYKVKSSNDNIIEGTF